MTVLPVDDYIATLCPKLWVDAGKDIYVDIATSVTSSTVFGDAYNYIVALRASHEYTLSQKDPSATGLVTGQSEGRTSISYWNATTKGSDSTLGLTTYGVRIKSYMKTIGIFASVSDPEAVL
jgi:hypothetical protein